MYSVVGSHPVEKSERKKKKKSSCKGSQSRPMASIKAGVIIGGAVLGRRVDRDGQTRPEGGSSFRNVPAVKEEDIVLSKHNVRNDIRNKETDGQWNNTIYKDNGNLRHFIECDREVSRYYLNDSEGINDANYEAEEIRISMDGEHADDDEWCEAPSHACAIQYRRITNQNSQCCSHCTFSSSGADIHSKIISGIRDFPPSQNFISMVDQSPPFGINMSSYQKPYKSSVSLTDSPRRSKRNQSKHDIGESIELRNRHSNKSNNITKSRSDDILYNNVNERMQTTKETKLYERRRKTSEHADEDGHIQSDMRVSRSQGDLMDSATRPTLTARIDIPEEKKENPREVAKRRRERERKRREAALPLMQRVLLSIKRLYEDEDEEDEADDFGVQVARHRPEELDKLARTTKFTRREIQLIYRGFKQECPTAMVDEDGFKKIFAQFFPQGDATKYAHYVFNTFKQNPIGQICFEDFLMALSTVSRGSTQEKLQWIFGLYDVNHDGMISKSEMEAVVNAIYEMLGQSIRPQVNDTTATDHVNRIFNMIDTNEDGMITIDEFAEWIANDETALQSLGMMDTVLYTRPPHPLVTRPSLSNP